MDYFAKFDNQVLGLQQILKEPLDHALQHVFISSNAVTLGLYCDPIPQTIMTSMLHYLRFGNNACSKEDAATPTKPPG